MFIVPQVLPGISPRQLIAPLQIVNRLLRRQPEQVSELLGGALAMGINPCIWSDARQAGQARRKRHLRQRFSQRGTIHFRQQRRKSGDQFSGGFAVALGLVESLLQSATIGSSSGCQCADSASINWSMASPVTPSGPASAKLAGLSVLAIFGRRPRP